MQMTGVCTEWGDNNSEVQEGYMNYNDEVTGLGQSLYLNVFLHGNITDVESWKIKRTILWIIQAETNIKKAPAL